MTDEEMPQPEAIWLALGIVTWALAAALTPSARTRFIDTLGRLSDEHETRRRIVAFPPTSLRARDIPRATRIAITWLRRLLTDLRAARGV